jgi:uncharacterized membrane protein (DUF4010 family)
MRSGGCHIADDSYHIGRVEPYEPHIAIAVALAVGLLVGLEREQSKAQAGSDATFGGVRTYPICALIGALSMMLESASSWLPLIALLGVCALVVVSYAADVRRADHGSTTEVSAIATYLLGALAAARGVIEPMADRLILVAGLGVALAFLLSSKRWFHALATRVSRDDFYATVKFLIVAVIALPLLPDRDLGPLGAINPRTLGMLVVTIAGLSFVGYLAMRLLGARRGLLVGAALGGLVSSTAVTLSFATRTKQDPALAPVAAGAIAIAWSIMLGRVIVVVALIEPSLLVPLAIPVGAMLVATVVGLLVTFRRRADGPPEAAEVKNPFELASAIKVTLIFGIVLLGSKAAIVYLGDRGLYFAAALAGTTDVDAVTLSSARLAHGGLAPTVAAISIVIAIAVNTAVKTALAGGVGGWALGKRTAFTGALVVAAGAAGLAASVAFV